MGIKSLIKEFYDLNLKSDILDPSTFQGFSFSSRKFAGVNVNPNTALAHDTVFACVRDKAESIGQLPVLLRRTSGDKTETVKQGREYRIFTRRPNDFQTMQEFIEMIVAALELRGNFYAYISRNKYGNISEILPFVNQTGVCPNLSTDGRVYYTYVTNDNKPAMAFAGADIIHIKNFTLNGFLGASAIHYGARSIGISISQEDYLASLMADGVMPKGILTTPNVFKDPNAIDRLKEQWAAYSGAKNSGKTPILENDLKYQAMSISPADADLISQRGFSREQVCGIMRVPPTRIGVSVQGSKRDLEEENRDYYQNKLMPIVTKIESAINYVLPDHLNIKIDERGFIRGNYKALVDAVTAEFKMGGISMNEMRIDLGRDPKDGGEVHAIDTNNLTFGLLTDIPKLQEQQRLLANKPNEEQDDDEEQVDDSTSA